MEPTGHNSWRPQNSHSVQLRPCPNESLGNILCLLSPKTAVKCTKSPISAAALILGLDTGNGRLSCVLWCVKCETSYDRSRENDAAKLRDKMCDDSHIINNNVSGVVIGHLSVTLTRV